MTRESELVGANIVDHIRYIGEGGGYELREKRSYLTLKTGLPHPMGNWVVGLGEPESPASLLPNGLPFLWLSEQWSESLDLQLRQLGLVADPMSGVMGQLDDLPTMEGDPRVSITEDLECWSGVASEVWGGPPQLMQTLFRAYDGEQQGGVLVVSRIGEDVVGCALLHCEGEVAGFHWGAVREEYRGQGIGSGLVRERIRIARERGCKVGVAACRHTSIGMYRHLGFEKVSDMASYIPAKYTKSLAAL